MPKLPTVAIVGRPMSASRPCSTAGGPQAGAVDDRPGVTRDRREGEASLLGLDFRVIRHRRYRTRIPATLPGGMRAQTVAAVREADAALSDPVPSRLTPLDEEIGRWLRSETTPGSWPPQGGRPRRRSGYHRSLVLGFGEPIAMSAEHGEGVVDLFEHSGRISSARRRKTRRGSGGPLKLAVVGRPNAGKSTLINRSWRKSG